MARCCLTFSLFLLIAVHVLISSVHAYLYFEDAEMGIEASNSTCWKDPDNLTGQAEVSEQYNNFLIHGEVYKYQAFVSSVRSTLDILAVGFPIAAATFKNTKYLKPWKIYLIILVSHEIYDLIHNWRNPGLLLASMFLKFIIILNSLLMTIVTYFYTKELAKDTAAILPGNAIKRKRLDSEAAVKLQE